MIHVSHLTVEDFGGIRLVDTPLGDGLTLVEGMNGSGKSTLLAALAALVNGRDAMPAVAVREGAERARVLGKLSDGSTIEITETAGGTFRLVLKDEKGHLVPSPAAALKLLRGWAGLDPVAFAWEKDARKLRDMLLAAMGVDTVALDREEATRREDRTIVGREGKALAGSVEKMPPLHAGAPEQEEVLATLLQELATGEEAARKAVTARERHAQAEKAADAAVQAFKAAKDRVLPDAGMDPDVAALEAQLAEARRQVAENAQRRAALNAHHSRVAELDRAMLDATNAALDAQIDLRGAERVPDVQALRDRVAGAEETNRKVRENRVRTKAEAELAASREKWAALSAEIDGVGKRRSELLHAAGLNVAGLSISGDGVQLGGRPWAAASTGERLRAAIEIRCASNPPLRVAWTTEGDKLDEENLAFVRGLCTERGLQLLMERTGIRDQGALVLVDGALREAVTP